MLVNGSQGEVIINPGKETINAFLEEEETLKVQQEEVRLAAQEPAITADGERVEVVANIGGLVDAPIGKKYGAEGVGLFRTEFLYLDRDALPTEEEQIEAYQSVFSHYLEMPLVVRTLDIGGDKVIPYLDLPVEMNPFLGWRGIRMLDGAEEIFLMQFRALIQAGALDKVDLRIMMPMVSGISEIRAAKALLKKAMAELDAEGKKYTHKVQIGIMIEVPSAAILADRLAPEVDFFSIGTNDLTQYTLAVDRTNSKVAHIGNPLDPAVLTLIKFTIDSAHAEGKWVGLCGELAGEPTATPILLGLGLDEFSMAPTRIPEIKKVLRNLHREDCVKLAQEVLRCSEAGEVVEKSRFFLSSRNIRF